MKIREMSLPEGWYPRGRAEAAAFLSGFASAAGRARAVIAPHAGWYYAGHIAARAVSGLEADAQTIIIAGGHLPRGMPPLFAMEDAVRTPLGLMPVDVELRDTLVRELAGREDKAADNTVEILVPIARYFFPAASLVWMRLPASAESFDSGGVVARAARALGRNARLISSADLTHYGANYGYSPAGSGEAALEWMREVNDARFISAVLAGDPALTLQTACRDLSCCSAGAVLGAMGFAARGDARARLLAYGTSADAQAAPPDSFVGYAAIAFE